LIPSEPPLGPLPTAHAADAGGGGHTLSAKLGVRAGRPQQPLRKEAGCPQGRTGGKRASFSGKDDG
jgi:hypothetical protein